MSDNIELRDGRLLDLAYARALIGRMRAKHCDPGSDRDAYNLAHLAETLYWQVVHTLDAVEDKSAAAREEGRRQGWAEAIAALRDREVWRADDPHDEFGTGQFVVLTAAADYLADQAPKEETHG